ncbi:MAG TPA: DUF1854 domain-containing protein [Limnochordia bacterium]
MPRYNPSNGYGARRAGADGGGEFVPLDERRLALRPSAYGGLEATLPDGTRCEPVYAALAFPLQAPDRYVALFDQDRRELGIIDNPARLDPESRSALAAELERAYCIPVIVQVESVVHDGFIPVWYVQTDRGPHRFELRSRRDARWIDGRRVLIKDADGNRYDIPDVTALDPRSRAIVEREV